MSATPAGLRRFSRSMITKFAGKCTFCYSPTVAGRDFAATSGQGWVAVCYTCAQSTSAQVAGVVASCEIIAEGHDVNLDDVLMPAEDNLIATLQGTADEALAFDTLLAMVSVRNQIHGQVALATVTPPAAALPPVAEALQAIAADSTAAPRDRTFAASLLTGLARYGTLTVRQVEAAERMVARLAKPSTTASGLPVPQGDPTNGLYVHADGTVRKIYTTQNDRIACKVLVIIDGHGSFEYSKGGKRTVAADLIAGTAHKMTEDEAHAFGKLHGFCCACARDLDDDRSLAVGYGPVCAKHYGWYYPNVAEAAAILARPTASVAQQQADVIAQIIQS